MKTFTRGGVTISVMAHYVRGPSDISQAQVDTLVLSNIDGDREAGLALFAQVVDTVRKGHVEWDITKTEWENFEL